MENKKVGIITWHFFDNFGSALQAYALQKTVERMGFKPKFLNYRIFFSKKIGIKLWPQYFVGKILKTLSVKKFVRYYYPFISFQKEKLSETAFLHKRSMLEAEAGKCAAVICGSDQIWAPNVFNPIYMLDFVDSKKVKKVSYAASIGLNEIPEKLVPEYSRRISDFSAVSVREEKGKQLLAETCGIDSEVVLDPTLLINVAEYRSMKRRVRGVKEPYIFCYFLNKNHNYKEKVEAFAKEQGLKIYGHSKRVEDGKWFNALDGLDPREFLWLVDNAEYVFTDSYHGTIFSLLFHKKFLTFERFTADDPICQNSRIFQLREYFDIGERIITEKDSPKINDYNYDDFEEKLGRLREKSLKFLREVL